MLALDEDVFEVAARQDADLAALGGQRLKGGVDRGVLADALDAVADGDGAATTGVLTAGVPRDAAVGRDCQRKNRRPREECSGGGCHVGRPW